MSEKIQFLLFKFEIQKLFDRLECVVVSLLILLTSFHQNTFLEGKFKKEDEDNIKSINASIERHKDKINCEKMKCVFFGQTSNGKSAMINAILGGKVLPSSDGRTTTCFITIEGCNAKTGYFMVDNVKKHDLSKLNEYADEMCKRPLSIDSQIRLFWPIEKCDLLKEDIQILDSPGADFSEKNDKWIETYCLNSDIFIFVVNGVGTINKSETEFFRKVNAFIKNSRIFVVINKWDLCDTEGNESSAKTKQQHYETTESFLCKDLKIDCKSSERTFFLSAKERLEYRDRSTEDVRKVERNEDFNKFYQTLCKEISDNAIISKFSPHIDTATDYISTIRTILERLTHAGGAKLSSTGQIQSDAMIGEINEYIEVIFKEIIKDGESEIESWSSQFAESVMNDGSDISLSERKYGEYIQEKMMKSLSDIFEGEIKRLVKKIKELFTTYSQFQLRDQDMNKYLPESFKEQVTSLGENLSKNLKKDNCRLKNQYSTKEMEPKGVDVHNVVSVVGDLAGSLGMSLMFKFPIASIVAMGVSGVMQAANKIFPGTDQKAERAKYLKDTTNEMLLTTMHKNYEEIKKEIEESMKKLVSKFCEDHDVACQLVIDVGAMKITCDELLDDINTEKLKIVSLDQR